MTDEELKRLQEIRERHEYDGGRLGEGYSVTKNAHADRAYLLDLLTAAEAEVDNLRFAYLGERDNATHWKGRADDAEAFVERLKQSQRTPLDEMERLTALLDKTPFGDNKSRAAIQDAVVRLANTITTPDTIRTQEKK